MFTISAPASSANMGPGFDSIGMAVDLNLTLKAEKANEWRFIHKTELIPAVKHYKDHYIYKVAKRIAKIYDKTLQPCKVNMYSEIPLARGLGSSASAIITGIELANQLCHLNLTAEEKLKHAVDIEGHPDNVAPALFGGVVISVKLNDDIYYKRISSVQTDTVICIPNEQLKTEDARKVLPEKVSLNYATKASGLTNVMITALMQNDYKLAGQMMENDLFHEPYRAKLIPNYNKIREKAKSFGAYGTVISGAGPTMISFVPRNEGYHIANKMKKYFPQYSIRNININNKGLQVTANESI